MNEFEHLMGKLEKVINGENDFPLDAYRFVMDALNFTSSRLEKHRHVTGKELLDGIKHYALKQYGPLARTVLEYWRIRTTEDFGRIVFDLVDAGILRKQPEDKIEDFRDVYDFRKAFQKVQFEDEGAE